MSAAAEEVREWYRRHNARRARNHVALMLAAREVLDALNRGSLPIDGTRRRLQACISEYDAVARDLRDRVDHPFGKATAAPAPEPQPKTEAA